MSNTQAFRFRLSCKSLVLAGFLVLTALTVIPGVPLHAGTLNWVRTYGNQYWVQGNSVVATSDGGFMVAANASDINNGGLVLKLDADGNIQWANRYGNNKYNSYQLKRILATKDGKYVLAGTHNHNDHGWLFLINADGIILWEKEYEGFAPIRDLGEMSDGNFIVCGGNGSSQVMKIDANGNVIWRTYIAGNSGAFSFHETDDKGVVFAGGGYGYYERPWIVKLNSAGNILWQKAYGMSCYSADVRSITPASDGSYVVAGYYKKSYYETASFLVFKVDANGIPIWPNAKAYVLPYATATSIIQMSNGDLIVGGRSFYSNKSNGEISLIGLSQTGAVRWQRTYGSVQSGGTQMLGPLSEINGNIFVVGTTRPDINDPSNYDLLLMNLSEIGTVGDNCDFIIDSSLQILDIPITVSDTGEIRNDTVYPPVNGAASVNEFSLESKTICQGSSMHPTIAQSPPSGPPGTTFVQWGTGFTPNSTATFHVKKPDGTEYDPWQQPLDNIGHFETSYRASLDKPPGIYTWLAIDDATGKKSNEVFYEIKALTESQSFFQFSEISKQQTVNVPFEVTITASDPNFSGDVCLDDNLRRRPDPWMVTFKDGKAFVKEVRLFTPGEEVYLVAHRGAETGRSDPFRVTGEELWWGDLQGKVKNPYGGKESGIGVYLENGDQKYNQVSDLDGKYSFSNIPCGNYRIWASDDDGSRRSRAWTIDLSTGQQTQDLEIIRYDETQKTPILLLPGIMGSSTGWDLYPELPSYSPSWDSSLWRLNSKSWGLHDPDFSWAHLVGRPGWRALVDAIKTRDNQYAVDLNIFPVPYDWRMNLNDVVDQYLIPAIDHAKQITGAGKVNVIAHSMGGLVVRAYIQNKSKYNNDIDKFAMVGTPNQGSAKPYYIWFGGDPHLADHTTQGWLDLDFYSKTCKLIYEAVYPNDKVFPLKIRWNSVLRRFEPYYDYDDGPSKIKIRKLARDHLITLKQLMPTYDFLKKGSSEPFDLGQDDENDFLISLNTNVNFKEYGVDARIFAGIDKDTITRVKVGEPNHDTYPQGVPLGKPETSIEGDGTVTLRSAEIGSITPKRETGEHAFLVSTFQDDLVNFLFEGISQKQSRQNLQAEEELRAELVISFKGMVSPYVIDPLGRGAGINYLTGELEESIPGVSTGIQSGTAAIRIENPAKGTYTVYVKGEHARDFDLKISCATSEKNFLAEATGFNHGAVQSFTFDFDIEEESSIQLDPALLAPNALRADPIQSGSQLYTRLTWEIRSEATAYNIYSKALSAPFLSLLTTTTSAMCDTGHDWAGSTDTTPHVYSVSAVKSDGAETFLSYPAKNDDRDHDGLSDAFEASSGSNPSNPDSDGDGLSDAEEYLAGTNPLVQDTDGDGYTDYQEIQCGTDPLDPTSVPIPLAADFGATPTSGLKPLSVQFTDNSAGAIQSYSWTFGGGGTSTEKNPSHTYNEVGVYPVSLTVTGPLGTDMETKAGYITVYDTVDLSVSMTDAPDPVSIGVNLIYQLTVSNTGPGEATGVTLTDLLPAGVTLVGKAATQGTCLVSGSSVSCNLGNLAAGGAVGVMIVVSPSSAGTITNSAQVAASEADSNLANNSVTATTTVSFGPEPVLTHDISGVCRYFNNDKPVSGVQLSLDGNQTLVQATDANGNYTFKDIPEGDHKLNPAKSDQVGNAISAMDASFVLQAVVGLITLNGYQATAADVNGNGSVSAMDASYILQKVVGLINLPFPGNNKIWTFDPVERNYTPLNSNQTSQDFKAILIGDVNGNWTPPVQTLETEAKAVSSKAKASQAQVLFKGEATISVGKAIRVSKGHFAVPLLVKVQKGQLLSAELTLGYAKNAFDVVAVNNGALSSEAMIASNLEQPGKIQIALASPSPIKGSGELVSVILKQKKQEAPAARVLIRKARLNDGPMKVTVNPKDWGGAKLQQEEDEPLSTGVAAGLEALTYKHP